MKTALILVQISTLDAYADHYGVDAARELARRWTNRVLHFDGPVVILDQKWPFQDPASRPRYEFVRRVELARDIHFVHDEEIEIPERFLGREADRLAELGIAKIVLGGLWYGPQGAYGAVAEAEGFFKRFFEVIVDQTLTAAGPEVRS